jgi:hypothetical protein
LTRPRGRCAFVRLALLCGNRHQAAVARSARTSWAIQAASGKMARPLVSSHRLIQAAQGPTQRAEHTDPGELQLAVNPKNGSRI